MHPLSRLALERYAALTPLPRAGQNEITLLTVNLAKAEGHVQVHVNTPKGLSTKTANSGSLSREVKLNGGNAMQLASEEA